MNFVTNHFKLPFLEQNDECKQPKLCTTINPAKKPNVIRKAQSLNHM